MSNTYAVFHDDGLFWDYFQSPLPTLPDGTIVIIRSGTKGTKYFYWRAFTDKHGECDYDEIGEEEIPATIRAQLLILNI